MNLGSGCRFYVSGSRFHVFGSPAGDSIGVDFRQFEPRILTLRVEFWPLGVDFGSLTVSFGPVQVDFWPL